MPLNIDDFEIAIPVNRIVAVNPFPLVMGQELFEMSSEEEEGAGTTS